MELIHSAEIVVNIFFQSLGAGLRVPFKLITFLGDEEFFILLLTALYWSFDQLTGIRVGIMLLLGNGFNTFFKFLFRTPRPYWISDSVKAYSLESSFGLPSGHSQLPASVWGWMAVEVRKRWFTLIALFLIFMIGISRIYLGVHFLSDVILGWTLGGLLVSASSAVHGRISKWGEEQTRGTKITLIASSAVLLLLMMGGARIGSSAWKMPSDWVGRTGDIDPFSLDGAFTLAGTWFGILSGYVLLSEKRGRFLASEGGWKRGARYIIGLGGVALFWYGLGKIFPRGANVLGYSLRFIRYTLTGLWVTWLAPLMFERFHILKFESPGSTMESEKDSAGTEDYMP